MKQNAVILPALRAAFPHTIPILTGFIFLGIVYGMYMSALGFSFWYPMLMALTIFGGSLEFIVGTMLLTAFSPLATFLLALMVQARHLFYGLSMLEKYKGLGWKKYYLIFGLCDETFSLNYSLKVPEGIDKGWFYFFITLLDQFYWVASSALGNILSSYIDLQLKGLDFALTAMFVVIFLDQWLKEEKHLNGILGIGVSICCLLAFGGRDFLIPTMLGILLLLTLLRKRLERTDTI